VGQPFCGYGIQHSGDNPATVIGVLIQKELFYRDFLPIVSTDPAMLRFFIEPRDDEFSTDFLRFSFPKDSPVRSLLELMIMEYADKHEDTQDVLKSLAGALILHIARRYRLIAPEKSGQSASDKIIAYMTRHLENVTLADIGRDFSYHPTYISNLLKKDTGSTFSEILLRLRMERAVMLMKGTTLRNEEIAAMLGYNDSSNFYKAFKEYYGMTPREYLK
jgi:AraC-like DNA-binding protein